MKQHVCGARGEPHFKWILISKEVKSGARNILIIG